MTLANKARREASKELARRKLIRFSKWVNPKYRDNFHHRTIAHALEAVARYSLHRVIIVAPPRHGKSELVSRNFPAWYLGNNQHRQIITATYGDALSTRMSADVRRIIASDEYKELYPGFAYGDVNRATEFNLEAGGSYYASGIRLAVTGMGANVILGDDPVKNREEAESELIRDKTHEAWNNDFMSRLEQPNAVVLMATRWHEDDLIGRTLNGPTASRWTVIHFPRVQDAEASKVDPRIQGAPLWPGRFLQPWERCDALDQWPFNCDEAMLRAAAKHKFDDIDEYALEAMNVPMEFDPDEHEVESIFQDDPNMAEDAKTPVDIEVLVARDLEHFNAFASTDAYGASALEQGRPTPRTGAFVDADAINTYTGTPAQRATYCPEMIISVDANFKKTKTSDFASLTVFGRTTKPNAIFPIDERHGRYSYPQLKRRLKELAHAYPRAAILIEAKANGQALIDELREEGFARVIAFEPDKYGSKDTRAQYAAEFIAGGGLFVPTADHAPWIRPWLEEVTKYGTMKNDDRMDSLSMVCIYWGVERRSTGLAALERVLALA